MLATKQQLVSIEELERIANEIIDGGVKKVKDLMRHKSSMIMTKDKWTEWHQLASTASDPIKLKIVEDKFIRELKDDFDWSVEQELARHGSKVVRDKLFIFTDSALVKEYIESCSENILRNADFTHV